MKDKLKTAAQLLAMGAICFFAFFIWPTIVG